MGSSGLLIIKKFDRIHNKLQVGSTFCKSWIIKIASMWVKKVPREKSDWTYDEEIIQPLEL